MRIGIEKREKSQKNMDDYRIGVTNKEDQETLTLTQQQ